jgi:hypothetical protein
MENVFVPDAHNPVRVDYSSILARIPPEGYQ